MRGHKGTLKKVPAKFKKTSYVNIYFSEEVYNQIKPLIKQRKISKFVNQVVEKELGKEQKQEKEQLREKLVTAYKRMAKNKKLQKEMALWYRISGDGLKNE